MFKPTDWPWSQLWTLWLQDRCAGSCMPSTKAHLMRRSSSDRLLMRLWYRKICCHQWKHKGTIEGDTGAPLLLHHRDGHGACNPRHQLWRQTTCSSNSTLRWFVLTLLCNARVHELLLQCCSVFLSGTCLWALVLIGQPASQNVFATTSRQHSRSIASKMLQLQLVRRAWCSQLQLHAKCGVTTWVTTWNVDTDHN